MAMTSSDAHAALDDIPEGDRDNGPTDSGGAAGGFRSPSFRAGLPPVPASPERSPGAGSVLPMLGRRASSVLAKYPGLPPLPPTSPDAKPEQ
jgi:hypothetical protein